jgi:hypothetical protein
MPPTSTSPPTHPLMVHRYCRHAIHAAMATFTISARADQTGFDVEVECGNDGRPTTRDFKTQEDAETWVVRRMQLIDRTDRSAQSGFRMLWRIR